MAIHAVLWTALVLGAQPPAAGPAQTPQTPATGLIVGRVVDGSSRRPVSGAVVSLVGGGTIGPGTSLGPAPPLPASLTTGPRAVTSASGQFVFRKVAKGNYTLQVARAGYVDGSYGRRAPGGSSAVLQLDDAQRVSEVVIPVWKHATISGTVVDEAGEPVIGAQVRAFQRRLLGGKRRLVQAAMAPTDDRGIYRFASLIPGEYLVAFVWREASLPASTAEMLRMPNPSDPKVSEILRTRLSVGGEMLSMNSLPAAGGVVRELQGGLPPPPSAEGAPVFIYPTQFYPGVPSLARAGVITVTSGQERESVDFSLRPVRTASVSGTVIGPEGPVPNVALRLGAAGEDLPQELDSSVTMTGPGGEFTLLGVPSGQYAVKILSVPRPPAPMAAPTMTQVQVGSSTIMTSTASPVGIAPPSIPDDPTLFAETVVSVAERDVSDLVVTLQRGARVTGRFEFDGSSERPAGAAMTRITVGFDRADAPGPVNPFSAPPPGRADESGMFKTFGVAPGKYILRIGGAPPPWTVKSVMSEGRDLSDVPVDLRTTDVANVVVTFTDRPTKLNGVVRGSDGNVDTGALVVVFPADSSAWSEYGMNPRRLRSARPLKNGSYSFTGLPAGDYYVAAIHEEDVPQWQEPQVLEDLARSATHVRLADGDTRVQDVKSTKAGGR